MSLYERIEFMSISFMHDTMYSLFMKPEKLLIPAGLKENQKVLEVGCGPGFFTIPAGKIVGENGTIYAIDINPFAIKKIQKKMAKSNIQNIEPMLVNVTDTGLPKKTIDVAFFFGVIHNLIKIIDDVILEMDRILKAEGTLSVQKHRKRAANIITLIEKSGKFVLLEEKERVLNFKRK